MENDKLNNDENPPARIDQVMENDKLNNVENPPASTSSVRGNDKVALTNRQNDAADTPGISHDGNSARVDPHVRWNYMYGRYQPYYPLSIPEYHGNITADSYQPHLQNPLIDQNSINIRTRTPTPSLYRRHLPFLQGNVKQLSYTPEKAGADDTTMNDSPHFYSSQNSEINRNFTTIRSSAGGGYGMTRPAGEAGSNFNGPQIKDFVGLGGTKTYYPQNRGEANVEGRDHAAQFICPNKFDGRFVSLGIGDKTNAGSDSDLRSREIPRKLDCVVSPQLNTSHIRQAAGSSLSPGQNLFGGFAMFQNNVGGFTNQLHNAAGRGSSNDYIGDICGTNTSFKSSPFHLLQKPQAGVQRGLAESSNRTLGFVGNRDSRYVNLDPCKGFIGEMATASGPFSCSSAGLLDSGHNEASGLTLESVKFNRTTTDPAYDPQQEFSMALLQNFSAESSKDSPFIGSKGSSTRQEHSGKPFSATDGTAPCASVSGPFPKRLWIQDNKDSAAQAAGSFLPRRRRVNEHSATQAAGYGHPKGKVISSAKHWGTSRASKGRGGPSLCRDAVPAPPAAPRVLRQKEALSPPILSSRPSPPKTAPGNVVLGHYIKWKGPHGLAQPTTGQKCMLCKRDLSFAPEGPVSQPTILTSVAVLPCGHTFHDHCLQLITPSEQAKDPPCIPCALGET